MGSYSSEGILTIHSPRKINAPEGAEVSEAMSAASKAFTTDGGKTAVKQDSSSASQMIATSTKSDDGSFSSSSTFSSSNMSSSSTTTSSSGGPGGMMSIGGGGGGDMDEMMKKMMEGMKMGGGSEMMSFGGDMGSMMSGSKMMSSKSSVSSSSSSMMSSSSSSKTVGSMMGGMGMPSMLDKMGAGVDFEELSTAGTEFSGPPAYTVTSPRPSVDNTGSGYKFTVQPTPDFKPKAQQEADCSVLLKLKKGYEYKFVLNMQQYSPENITVKLNGNELTVLATGGDGSTDDFKQTHVVSEGIDLDQMTSSFSSDGVLVIKAPRKK